MIACVFPGQGSQSVGMGKEIYDAFPAAREVFEEVNDALNQNLTKIIFEGPEETLTLTENTQPALMTVSLALLKVLEKEGGLKIPEKVSFMAGHSLGEYSALAGLGVLSLSDTAQLLRLRGQAMQKAVPVGVGAMAALLGIDLLEVEEIVQEAAQSQVCAISNDNAPGQVVISGHKEAVERASELAKQRGAKRAVILPVSAPFHCTLMAPAATAMKDALHPVLFQKPSTGFVANISAAPLKEPEEIKESLVQQVTDRVRWRETILYFESQGVQTVIEIGAGKVLAGLTKRITPSLTTLTIQMPQDMEEITRYI